MKITIWSIDTLSSHLTNQPEVNHLVQRLVHTFTNNNNSKDAILDILKKGSWQKTASQQSIKSAKEFCKKSG